MTEYRFITTWKFNCPLEKVYAVILDADHYHLWWRGQAKVEVIRIGNGNGVGAVRRFRTSSFLPYSLVYNGTVLDVVPMEKIEGNTVGDLEGHGVWLFKTENKLTIAQYHWDVRTTKPWMNLVAPVAKPFFEWNHHLVMKWGGEGLAKYLGCGMVS